MADDNVASILPRIKVRTVWEIDCGICGQGVENAETGDYQFRSRADATRARWEHAVHVHGRPAVTR